jgi:SAM-dependent methyltransferase
MGLVDSIEKTGILCKAMQTLELNFLDQKVSSGQHAWIPFSCSMFVDLLMAGSRFFKSDRTKRFLDIGCGIGTKVLLADVLFEAYGFDLRLDYLEVARRFGCERVFPAEAMEFDWYHDYDFLYFYAPFRDEEMEAKFEKRLSEKMKVGAIIAPIHSALRWDQLPGFEPVGKDLLCKRV